jgi:hypothetical protein
MTTVNTIGNAANPIQWGSTGFCAPFRAMYERDKKAHDALYTFGSKLIERSLDDTGTVLHWGADLTNKIAPNQNGKGVNQALTSAGNGLKQAANWRDLWKLAIGLPISLAESAIASPFHMLVPFPLHVAPNLLAKGLFMGRLGGSYMDISAQISQWVKLGKQHAGIDAALNLLQKKHPEALQALIKATSNAPLAADAFSSQNVSATLRQYLAQIHKLPKEQLLALVETPAFKALAIDKMMLGQPDAFARLIERPTQSLLGHMNGTGKHWLSNAFSWLGQKLGSWFVPVTKLLAKVA